jgi:hypothetical protein
LHEEWQEHATAGKLDFTLSLRKSKAIGASLPFEVHTENTNDVPRSLVTRHEKCRALAPIRLTELENKDSQKKKNMDNNTMIISFQKHKRNSTPKITQQETPTILAR